MKEEVVLIDIGNTQVKSTQVIDGDFMPREYWTDLDILLLNLSDTVPLMISSVKKSNFEKLKNYDFLVLDHKLPLPIKSNYKTPESLGADRIAMAVGGYFLFPSQNCLMIDLGTCMTVDLLTEKGVFEGGIIAPGLNMRLKAMSTFTDNLPYLTQKKWNFSDTELIGQSTSISLFKGAYDGMCREINGLISDFKQKISSIKVIVSGGDAHFFVSNIKEPIFVNLKIVEEGLYRIWKYQKEKHL